LPGPPTNTFANSTRPIQVDKPLIGVAITIIIDPITTLNAHRPSVSWAGHTLTVRRTLGDAAREARTSTDRADTIQLRETFIDTPVAVVICPITILYTGRHVLSITEYPRAIRGTYIHPEGPTDTNADAAGTINVWKRFIRLTIAVIIKPVADFITTDAWLRITDDPVAVFGADTDARAQAGTSTHLTSCIKARIFFIGLAVTIVIDGVTCFRLRCQRLSWTLNTATVRRADT
jgi:hypothetical protein